MPHRDDLEAAHARIAALEREKAESDMLRADLEEQVDEKDRRIKALAVVPKQLTELSRIVGRVSDQQLIRAVGKAAGIEGVDRRGRDLVWSGERYELRAERTEHGVLLTGKTTGSVGPAIAALLLWFFGGALATASLAIGGVALVAGFALIFYTGLVEHQAKKRLRAALDETALLLADETDLP